MSTTVVILNWNTVAETLTCLTQLRPQVTPDTRVIVLDNGSRNDEAKILRERFATYPGKLEVLRIEKNIGFAGGVNHCFRYALRTEKPEYFLLLNNDAEMPAGLFQEFREQMARRPEVGALGAPIHEPNSFQSLMVRGRISWWTGGTSFTDEPLDQEFCPVETIHGACFIFRAEVFDKIGLFDEDYFVYFEETDFCVRTQRAGYVLGVLPRFRIEHESGASMKKASGHREYFMLRNRFRFVYKNAPIPQKWAALGMTLLQGLKRLVRAVVKGEWELVRPNVLGIRDGLFRLPKRAYGD